MYFTDYYSNALYFYLIFIINVHIIGNLHFKNFINLINALNKKLNSPLSLVIFVMIAIYLITS